MKVVLGWHMHQPDYRDPESGRFTRPWTYLHAIKDYVDMAAHLEAVPAARAVVNFSPILLEQLEDYAARLRRALHDGESLADPVLDALQRLPPREHETARVELIGALRRANEARQIGRFPDYARLMRLAAVVDDDAGAVAYLDDQLIADLAVWFHLAWLGETVRRQDLRVKQLSARGSGYSVGDRRLLLEIIAEQMDGLLPRYRALAECGRVELSVTPYAHPMLPLLVDWHSAREALPDLALPRGQAIVNGEERARWHLEEARGVFRRCFGHEPRGCWPSEGGISNAVTALIDEQGFAWTASGEGVLRHSLDAPGEYSYGPYQPDALALRCFFRNDRLSDLIGFTFSSWHADDAVAHLVGELDKLAASGDRMRHAVMPIFLDGENAWEHYPENGFHFLRALYERLVEHPHLELATFSDCLGETVPVTPLASITAGSWVFGTFSTWIGHADKNRAWEMLAEAEAAHAAARAGGRLGETRMAEAKRQLAVCEASDWFWWPGPDNPDLSVREFDRLYRMQLERLYGLLGTPAPGYLSSPFTRGGGDAEAGGVMRRGSAS